jgi:Fe2+ transport system protein B
MDEEGNELPPLKSSNLQIIKSKLGIEVLPISSVAGEGIDELKDALWTELNKEQNQVIEISHAPIDVTVIERDENDQMADDQMENEETIYLNEVEEEWDLDKYKGIGWDN